MNALHRDDNNLKKNERIKYVCRSTFVYKNQYLHTVTLYCGSAAQPWLSILCCCCCLLLSPNPRQLSVFLKIVRYFVLIFIFYFIFFLNEIQEPWMSTRSRNKHKFLPGWTRSCLSCVCPSACLSVYVCNLMLRHCCSYFLFIYFIIVIIIFCLLIMSYFIICCFKSLQWQLLLMLHF